VFAESFKTRPWNGPNTVPLFLLFLSQVSQEIQVVVAEEVLTAVEAVVVEEVEEAVVVAEEVLMAVEAAVVEEAMVVAEEVLTAVEAAVVEEAVVVAEEVLTAVEAAVVVEAAVLRAGMLAWRAGAVKADSEVSFRASRIQGSPYLCPQSFWLTPSAHADKLLRKFLSIVWSVLIWKVSSSAAAARSAFFKSPFPTIASSCSTFALSEPMHSKLEVCGKF